MTHSAKWVCELRKQLLSGIIVKFNKGKCNGLDSRNKHILTCNINKTGCGFNCCFGLMLLLLGTHLHYVAN